MRGIQEKVVAETIFARTWMMEELQMQDFLQMWIRAGEIVRREELKQMCQ